MCHKMRGFAIALIIAAISASVWAAPPVSRAAGKGKGWGKGAGAANQPEALFKRADMAFVKGDRSTAGAQMSQAAAMLRTQAARLPKEDKAPLGTAAAEIGMLARDVAKTDNKHMRQAFARADLALGRYHHRQAGQAWMKKQPVAAGMNLTVAAMQVEHAATWIGYKATPQQVANAKNAGMLGQKLAQGAKVSPEELAKAFKLIGSEIEGLSGMLPPAKLK